MNIDKILDERLKVDQLEKQDSRLKSDTELKPVKTRLKRPKATPGSINVAPQAVPAPVSESIEEQEEMAIEEPENTGGAIPSGNNYTLQNAKDQLDGIIEKWMDLSGNYPTGEQRDKFLEIGERLREISGVLYRDFLDDSGESQADISEPDLDELDSDLDFSLGEGKIFAEGIDGLPDSFDPYAPMEPQRTDMKPDKQEEGQESGLPFTGEPPSDQAPTEADPNDLLDAGGLLEPRVPVWEPLDLPNKKDIGFQRSDGFKMRLRKLSSVPGRYLAQLWSQEKVLDSGIVDIPVEEDPSRFVQKMSDYMLDGSSNRYEQDAEVEEPAQDYGTQLDDQDADMTAEPDLGVADEFPDEEEILDATQSEFESEEELESENYEDDGSFDVEDIAIDLGEAVFNPDEAFDVISEDDIPR